VIRLRVEGLECDVPAGVWRELRVLVTATQKASDLRPSFGSDTYIASLIGRRGEPMPSHHGRAKRPPGEVAGLGTS
jgi:hypothetical protein